MAQSVEAVVAEYLPAPQMVQTVEAVAAEYMPETQFSQLEEPAVAWNLPAWQDVQVAATEEVDPAGPYSPAAHKEPEQVVAPVFDAYFPAPQGRQASSGRPYGLCLPLPLEVPAEQG